MGRIKQGILGGFSKKVGSVIGGAWKGIAYMRAMPLSVANPRTTAQVAQRDKMKGAVAFAQSILSDIIIPNWNRFAVKMSGYNMWIKTNIECFTDGSLESPSLLKITMGKMASTPITTASADVSGDEVQIIWNPALSGAFQGADDIGVVMAFNATNYAISLSSTPFTRNATSTAFPLPEGTLAGDDIYCYLGFRRSDGTVVSDSVVLMTTAVA